MYVNSLGIRIILILDYQRRNWIPYLRILRWIWGCGGLDWGKRGQQQREQLRRKGFNFEVVARLQNRVVAVGVGSLAAESAVRFRCAHDLYYLCHMTVPGITSVPKALIFGCNNII